MPFAYHKDVPTEVFVPLALALLGLVALLLYRRLGELPDDNGRAGSNRAATAAIALGLVSAAAYGLAWLVPTEAESGVRRTVGDVGLVVTLAYAVGVGPVLGTASISRARSRRQRGRAITGFLIGFVGLAFGVGSIVACSVSDGCFH